MAFYSVDLVCYLAGMWMEFGKWIQRGIKFLGIAMKEMAETLKGTVTWVWQGCCGHSCSTQHPGLQRSIFSTGKQTASLFEIQRLGPRLWKPDPLWMSFRLAPSTVWILIPQWEINESLFAYQIYTMSQSCLARLMWPSLAYPTEPPELSRCRSAFLTDQ